MTCTDGSWAQLEGRAQDVYFASRPYAAAALGLSAGRPLTHSLRPPASREERRRLSARIEGVLSEVAAWPHPLTPSEARESAVIRSLLEADLVSLRVGWPEFTVAPLPEAGLASGALIFLPYAAVGDLAGAEHYLALCEEVPAYLEAGLSALADGRAGGRLPVARLVANSARQLRSYLSSALDDDPHLSPLAGLEDARLSAQLRDLVTHRLRPAYAAYAEHLETEVIAGARGDDSVSLLAVPGGPEIYAAAIHERTTFAADPRHLHELGKSHVETLRAEAAEIARQLGWDSEFPSLAARLRTDPALRFQTREEILDQAEVAMTRAERAVPTWICPAPTARCVIRPMQPFEEESGVIGHYETAPLDRSRPATYWVNTSAPRTRMRFEAEALAFHESVPGHHLEIAMSQELGGAAGGFARLAGILPYSEGWALYMEGFADEIGLYTSPLARLGRVSFALWRASRLVVDSGIHAHGWSRSAAVDYLDKNTFLAAANIDNEVDRYIAHPGSAHAYLLGALAIRHIRDAVIGATLDPVPLRDFHTSVLAGGPRPLLMLADEFGVTISDWLMPPT